MMDRQRVILKADDLKCDKKDVLSPGWARFIRYVIREDLKASIGLIGKSLDDGSEKYFSLLREFHKSSFFELWNHGYSHLLEGVNEAGQMCAEFRNTSYRYQKAHLAKTQALAREKLGIMMRAFGAPGNKIDDTTRRVIDENDEIAVWLFGNPDSEKRVLSHMVRAEEPVRTPNYGKFLSEYDPRLDYIVLQVHPNKWRQAQFDQFFQIVTFLQHQNCVFTTPLAYHRYLSG